MTVIAYLLGLATLPALWLAAVAAASACDYFVLANYRQRADQPDVRRLWIALWWRPQVFIVTGRRVFVIGFPGDGPRKRLVKLIDRPKVQPS